MRLLLGVTGGIAAYKACELTSLAKKRGHEVQVILTAGGARFVGAASFEGLSGRPVMTEVFADAMAHIELAKWAEVAVVAPLTAHTMAKLACGMADDALTTTFLALRRGTPRLLCPAMNTEMWFAPVTQRNLGWLRDLPDVHLVDPVDKRLACGDVGVGGLAPVDEILAAAERLAPSPA